MQQMQRRSTPAAIRRPYFKLMKDWEDSNTRISTATGRLRMPTEHFSVTRTQNSIMDWILE
jgi:hypothetical protein